MDKTIVALYNSMSEAQQAVNELINAGIDRSQISLVANDASGEHSRQHTSGYDHSEDAVKPGEGAAFGGVTGGIAGALIGLGSLAIPGIGPVLAAGPLVGALTGGVLGAAAGAATGGIVAALVKTGVPREDAEHYAEGVRRGGALLTVHVGSEQANRAQDILNRFNPTDIDTHGANWRQEGWTGFREDAQPYDSQQIEQMRGNQTVLPVVEEDLEVGKREVEKGTVRVTKQVYETPVEEQIRLREERVRVERRPVDRPISDADQAFREQSIEVTERGEEPVVAKSARVVEEVVVGKEVEEHTETVRDTVRRSEVEVENTGTTGTSGMTGRTQSGSGFDTLDFRSHFSSNYANSGYTYDQYMPVYRYGYDLANDARYQSRNWDEIESDVRAEWNRRNPDNPWERFRDAVRHAWDQVRGRA